MAKDELAVIGSSEDADSFKRARRKALKIVEQVLDLPNDLESFEGDQLMQHRRLTLQANVAQSVIADTIKVHEAVLRDQERSDLLDVLKDQLKAFQPPSRDR